MTRTRLILISALFFCQAQSDAGGFYFETGVGASNINGGASFFGPPAPDKTNFGFAYNGMLGYNLLSELSLIQFHVGSSRVDLQACKLEYSIVSPK